MVENIKWQFDILSLMNYLILIDLQVYVIIVSKGSHVWIQPICLVTLNDPLGSGVHV